MTDKKKLANRIPFESLEKESAVSAWALPSMDKKSRLVYSAKREQQTKKNDPNTHESVEDYKAPLKPKPLTADQLQKLAAEAKQEGYDSGYAEGLQTGLSDGTARGLQEGEKKAYTETRKQLQDETARLALICENLFNPMDAQGQDLENIIIEMALQFTKELIAKEINETPQHLVSIVKQALVALPAGAKNISVFCNEKDAALVQKYCPKDNRNWIIKVDDTVARGGCRVETLESLVDYTIEQRMTAFLQQIQEKGEIDPASMQAPADYVGEASARLAESKASEAVDEKIRQEHANENEKETPKQNQGDSETPSTNDTQINDTARD